MSILQDALAKLNAIYRVSDDLMRARIKIQLQEQSICRSWIAKRLPQDLPEDKMKEKIVAEGAKLYKLVLTGAHPLAEQLKPYIAARVPLENDEAIAIKQMMALLPSMPEKFVQWVEDMPGLGHLSVLRIIAELGDPGEYANPAKCWKRLGLGVFDGLRQSTIPKGLSEDAAKEAWVLRGYSKRRRSVTFVAVDSLLKNTNNPYYKIYIDRKAIEIERVETKMHAHRRAQRYVTKRLIVELWKQWHRAIGKLPAAETAETEARAAQA